MSIFSTFDLDRVSESFFAQYPGVIVERIRELLPMPETRFTTC